MLLRRLWYPLAVVLMLGQMAFAMLSTAVQQSPTIDEPVYVATAAIYTQQHSLRYNPEHPPLGKLAMAVGLAFDDARLDPAYAGGQGSLGRHLLYETGNNPFRLLLLARTPMIVLTLLFGLVVLGFARDLAGPWAGLLALGLYTFSPDVIAHGSLATLDVPAAGLLLLSFWMLWRARIRPGRYLPLAGLALGAALATRMSALAAVPFVLGLALLAPPLRRRRAEPAPESAPGTTPESAPKPAPGTAPKPAPGTAPESAPGTAPESAPGTAPESVAILIKPESETRAAIKPESETRTSTGTRGETGGGTDGEAGGGTRWRRLGMRLLAAAGVGVIAVAVVWLVYLAVDPRLRWTPPVGLRNPGGLRGLAVDLLPFPQAYKDGVLIQFRFEAKLFNGFLFGEAYRGSRWYYLPAALLIKTPLGMMALWVAGTLTVLIKPALRLAALYLIVPAGAMMVAAMAGSRPYGSRYVIFMPIFLAVVAGTVLLVRVRWVRAAAVALTGFVAISSIRTFPNYLPYSNEAFGGTANTHNVLHDSNVDWGQDLPRLSARLKERYPGQPVWLVYKGSGVPTYYGIRSQNPLGPVPLDRVRGLLVVSDSRVALAKNKLKQLIDTSTPIDQVGHSITIYRR